LKLYFSVELKISESNLISIFFQENLLIPLKTDYIKASINSFNVPLQVTMQNLKVYNAEVSIPEFLKNEKNRKLKIDFNKNLTSDQGASLNKSDFQVALFDHVSQETLENIENLQNTGKTLTTAAATSALCSGAILMNPTMIFNLLNLVEMFSYALLFDVKFHQKFVEFVVSLKTSSKIPTVRLPIKTNEHRLPEKFVLYGIDSSFFIVNGGFLTAFLILTLIFTISVQFFSYCVKNARFKSICLKVKQFVYFRWFFRICLQSCFDFGVFTLLSLRYTGFDDSISFFDTFFCVVIIVRIIQLFVFACCGIYVLLITKINFPKTTEEIQEQYPYFYCLYEEFDCKKWNYCLFYLIFLTRRIFLSVLIMFSNGIIQLMVGISFSLMVKNK
jgi:hypothetical protein